MSEVSKGLLLPVLGINSCLEPGKIYKKSSIFSSNIHIKKYKVYSLYNHCKLCWIYKMHSCN